MAERKRINNQENQIPANIEELINRYGLDNLEYNADVTNEKISSVMEKTEGNTKKISSIEQTAENITTTVSEIQEDLDDNYYTKTETNSQINQTASAITSTVSSIQTNLNNNYYTKTETNSQINQTASEIRSTVSTKVGEDEICSVISQRPESISISGNRLSLVSDNFQLTPTGVMTAKAAKFYGNDENTTLAIGDGLGLAANWNSGTSVGNYNPYIYCRRVETGSGSSASLTKMTPEGFEFYGGRAPNNANGCYGKIYMSPANTQIISIDGVSLYLDKNLNVDSGTICSLYTYNNNTVTGSPNLYITSNGYFRRTTNTSSQRYKTDIKDVESEELNPNRLYDLPVRQFKYKKEYFNNKEDPRYDKELIGLIAEEVEKHFPIAVDYETDENGNKYVENWNEKYMVPAMLKLIQDLNERVKKLEANK